MKSKDYNDMLEDIFIPFSEDMMPDEMIFMQDNASIHVSRESKNWFEARNIELLKWPARSPDLNPIENLWGILARDVYGGGKQYGTVQELEVAVRNSWRNIRLPLLEKLVDSMPGRLFELVQRNGKQLLLQDYSNTQ
jgi:transposase